MKEFSTNISINPEIRFGKPCIKGTRISVNDILLWMASGELQEQILEDYPSLKKRRYFSCIGLRRQPGIHHQNHSCINMKLLLDANISWRLAKRF